MTQSKLTHIESSKLLHALVANRRRYFAFCESGSTDISEKSRLEVEYQNIIYLQNHNPSQDSHLNGADYTRVEVRRENSALEGDVKTLQTQPTSEQGVYVCVCKSAGLNTLENSL